MEKNYDLMLDCRAVFVRSIVLLFDGDYQYDNRFELLLKYFFDSYVYVVPELFDMIYDVRTNEDGTKYIYEDEETKKKFIKKLKKINSNYTYADTCDKIGKDKVKLISELAELFYEYVLQVVDIKNNRNRILS